MIDLKHFERKLASFPRHYMKHFDDFWEWKLKVETRHEHILDNNHRRKATEELCKILPRWQTYRAGYAPVNTDPLATLKLSLQTISESYNQIRTHTLLEFSKTIEEPLKLIWHELGRVKEPHGNRNNAGRYYVISVCKPLMLLWGQTLAFDSRVREHASHLVPTESKWTYEEWAQTMKRFQNNLKQEYAVITTFREKSLKKYKTTSIVPYGRFLDIYYF